MLWGKYSLLWRQYSMALGVLWAQSFLGRLMHVLMQL